MWHWSRLYFTDKTIKLQMIICKVCLHTMLIIFQRKPIFCFGLIFDLLVWLLQPSYKKWERRQFFLVTNLQTDKIRVSICYVADIVQSGSQVILTCAYSVSPGEYIDSIKWYLNNSECYRIVPGLTQVTPAPHWSVCFDAELWLAQDRVLTFPPGGACISLPQSGILRPGTHRLVINNASQLCSGKYICQVGSDWSVIRMTVLSLAVTGHGEQATFQNRAGCCGPQRVRWERK